MSLALVGANIASVVSVVGLAPRIAGAQPSTLDPIAAEALFTEGRAAAKRQDFAAACPKFTESFRLDPAPGTLLNLADCEEATGKIASAWLHYRQVAEMFPPSDERVAYARQRTQALEPHMPRLTIDLASTAPHDTSVQRNGVPLGSASLGVPLPLDPGSHVIIVRASGFADRKYVVEVGADQKQSVEVDVGERKTEVTMISRPGSWWGTRRTVGAVVGSVGLLGITAGAITGTIVLDRKSTVNKHCDAMDRCDAAGVDAAKQGRTFSTVSTITFAAGLSAVALGTILLVSGSPASPEQITSPPASTARGHVRLPQLDPQVAPGSATLVLTGAFLALIHRSHVDAGALRRAANVLGVLWIVLVGTPSCAKLVGADFDVSATGGASGAGAAGTSGSSGNSGTAGTSGMSGTSGAMAGTAPGGTSGSAGAGECPSELPGPTLLRVGEGQHGLCIDSTEVTRSQYAAFLDAGGPTEAIPGCGWKSSWTPSCEDPLSHRDALPVVCVDWCDAAAFCSWSGKRLCGGRNGLSISPENADDPVLDQWSFACMSGPAAHKYVYGNQFMANACNDKERDGTGCGGQGTCTRTSVGTLSSCQSSEPGFTGVLDLIGNVAEWEDSCSDPSGTGDPSEVTCLLRGGSIHEGASAICASETFLPRNAAYPGVDSLAATGFRCCL